MRRAGLLVLLGVFLVGLVASSTAGAQSSLRLATQDVSDPLQVEPPVVSFTGDGTGYLGGRQTSPRHLDRGGLHWLSWGRRTARATGYAWLNDCRPYCARGHFHPHRARVGVRRPRHGLFTRMTIKFKYGGRWVYDHRALGYVDGYYQWDICGSRYTKPC